MSTHKAVTTLRYLILFFCILLPTLSSADELKVLVTIKPVHSIVAGLMEGIEEPRLLIDGSPFDFDPDSSQQQMLSQSDLVIWVGPELERSIQPLLSSLPAKVMVVELLSNPRLKILSKRHDDNFRDPYFWLDTRNALIVLDELAYSLIDIDPVRTHIYTRNRAKMREKLRKLDHELEYGYRGLQGGVGYQYHDTLQYFEQAYALKTGGELFDSPDSKLDTLKLLKIRTQLADGDFDCVLTENGLPDNELELFIPPNSNLVWQLDSLGLQFKPGADLYIQLMQYNSAVIKQCLKINNKLDRIDSGLADEIGDINDEGRFMLLNHLGELVTEKDMLGKYQLLFFGYTSCPDVCPLSLHILTMALNELGEDAKKFQGYFITVDPERDDVDTMRQYVDYFENKIIGLTGQPAMLRQAAKHYRVKYKKVYSGDNRDDYQMDHTAGLFVVAPDGQFITKLAHGISSTTMAKALKTIVK